jgi:hypothetical protein
MNSAVKRGHHRRAISFLAGGTLLLAGSSTAHAIFDMGMGWGWGFGNVPSPSQYLNDHALVRAARPREGVPPRSPYANNPNAYINRIRDPGFTSHMDVRRRSAPSYRPQRSASLANQGAAPPAAQAFAPLDSFFDEARKLLWPSDAPNAGELKEKRNISDTASLAVLDETKLRGTASITLVTNARQRLIDYGKPALREIRTNSTAPVADAFHSFLWSLYGSLEQAAGPTPQ